VAESAFLDALIDGLHGNTGRALIVRGETGIGKSALLRHSRERVRAMDGL
jgi:ABC-type transport system involved in cytochrome c biogenesis ATPase subunit